MTEARIYATHPNDLQIKHVRRTDWNRTWDQLESSVAGELPRSESKLTCPHCHRLPGSVHDDKCPRSRKSMRRQQNANWRRRR